MEFAFTNSAVESIGYIELLEEAVNAVEGSFIFAPPTDGVGNTSTERMRILSAGSVRINNTALFGAEQLGVLAADNGTVAGLKINASQANITGADVFTEFRSTDGVEANVVGTGVLGVIAYNTFTGGHYTQLADESEEVLIGMFL